MTWKSFTLGFIWFWISILDIMLFSTRDKEWMTGSGEINNFCQLVISIPEDDTRAFGVLMTVPLFFPLLYVIFWKKCTIGICASFSPSFLLIGYGSFLYVTTGVFKPDTFCPARRHPAQIKLQTPRRATSGRRQRSPGFTSVERFQTHLERWERHVYPVLAETGEDQLVDFVA